VQQDDPQEVVIDEVLGVWVTHLLGMLGGHGLGMANATPHAAFLAILGYAAGGFVLFRVCDIVKPGPVGWIDRRWPSVWGILWDDVVAGILGGGMLYLLGVLLPGIW
jgi:phosphatidylglycerophosphatase A